MMMNSEQAGDRVFVDVDRALAEKIILRSRENNRGAAPAFDAAACADDIRHGNGLPRIIAIAAAVGALLILAALIFRRGGR